MLRIAVNWMIKTLLLIIAPIRTWDGILRAQKTIGFVLGTHLLPVMLISCIIEGYGLIRWGKMQGDLPHLVRLTSGEAVIFETLQFMILLGLVVLNAGLLRSTSSTFHGRHTFAQGFKTIAYGIGPVLLFRCLNAFPQISPWMSWVFGILLSISVLYHGVPKIMDPDPAHAFGLYVVTCLLMFFTTGLLALLATLCLKGEFPKLMSLISGLGARLPF